MWWGSGAGRGRLLKTFMKKVKKRGKNFDQNRVFRKSKSYRNSYGKSGQILPEKWQFLPEKWLFCGSKQRERIARSSYGFFVAVG